MDRRILKTKKALHNALTELCTEKDFDRITVKEICDKANTGRVTFYTYYEDKNALLEECLTEVRDECLAIFKKRQLLAGAGELTHTDTILNLLDSILDVIEEYSPVSNMLLNSSDIQIRYFHMILDSLNTVTKALGIHVDTDVDRKRIYAFLIIGSWGFIHARPVEDWDKLRTEVKSFATRILESNIFYSAS